jgi:hypothetical protein
MSDYLLLLAAVLVCGRHGYLRGKVWRDTK